MPMATASHKNHLYNQYVGLQVQGHEGNHVRPTEWNNKGKNTALAAQESPVTRAQVNSYSALWAKAGCRAANGKCSASQWLQYLRHCARTECLLAGYFYIPELLFLQVGAKYSTVPNTLCFTILKNAAIWLPKFPNSKCLYFQLN